MSIKNTIKENIKLDYNKFRKIFYDKNMGYFSVVMYLYFLLIVIYYGGLVFTPLIIFIYFEAMLDKNKSNKKFIKFYTWISWTITIILMFYSVYLLLK